MAPAGAHGLGGAAHGFSARATMPGRPLLHAAGQRAPHRWTSATAWSAVAARPHGRLSRKGAPSPHMSIGHGARSHRRLSGRQPQHGTKCAAPTRLVLPAASALVSAFLARGLGPQRARFPPAGAIAGGPIRSATGRHGWQRRSFSPGGQCTGEGGSRHTAGRRDGCGRCTPRRTLKASLLEESLPGRAASCWPQRGVSAALPPRGLEPLAAQVQEPWVRQDGMWARPARAEPQLPGTQMWGRTPWLIEARPCTPRTLGSGPFGIG